MSKNTVVITGATSGIGKAAALGFAKAGYSLVLCGRREDRLSSIEAECAGLGAHVLSVVCDVTQEQQVANLFAAAQEKFGSIDTVFNNAGMFVPATRIDKTTLADFQTGIDVNLTGAFLVAREAFRVMVAQNPQGGRIINNGSIAAYVPRPNSVSYSMSKHAIAGLTKSISLEGRGLNIACSQIDIGNTATDMTKDMGAGMLQPSGRIEPEPTFDVSHVVDALVFMAGLPLDANVSNMTILATEMPFGGRG